MTYERGLLDPVTLRAARVSSAGQVLANEILVADAGDHADYSELATLPDGGVIAVWEDDRHDVGDVFTTVIPADGAPATPQALALGAPMGRWTHPILSLAFHIWDRIRRKLHF